MWIILTKKNGVNFPCRQVYDLLPVSVPILSFVAKEPFRILAKPANSRGGLVKVLVKSNNFKIKHFKV